MDRSLGAVNDTVEFWGDSQGRPLAPLGLSGALGSV